MAGDGVLRGVRELGAVPLATHATPSPLIAPLTSHLPCHTPSPPTPSHQPPTSHPPLTSPPLSPHPSPPSPPQVVTLLDKVSTGGVGSQLSSLSISGLYLGVVWAVGKFVRVSVTNMKLKIPYEQTPDPKVRYDMISV